MIGKVDKALTHPTIPVTAWIDFSTAVEVVCEFADCDELQINYFSLWTAERLERAARLIRRKLEAK